MYPEKTKKFMQTTDLYKFEKYLAFFTDSAVILN